MRPGLQDQYHRQPGRPVHGPYPPPVADPDIRLVGCTAREAAALLLALPGRLLGDRIVEGLDPHGALKRKAGPVDKVRKFGGCLRHDPTLAERRTAVVPRGYRHPAP